MFAQQMREMLNPQTFESFRVYSLDTSARLKEALELIDDVKRGRVPVATLQPVAEELSWSLSKDTAAKNLVPAEISSLLKVMKNKNNLDVEAFSAHIKLMQKLIGERYQETIEERTLTIFSDPKNRTELRKLTGFYCSHIVNLGYSRRHVLKLVNEHFFDQPIQRIGRASLVKFFRKFDGKKKRFIVHAAVTKDLAHYLKGLGFQTRDISTLSTEQKNSLSENHNYQNTPLAIEVFTDTFDPYGAMDFCYQTLSSQRAIAYLNPQGMQSEWGEIMHVTRARAKGGSPISKGDFLLNSPHKHTMRSGKHIKNISKYAKNLQSNFDANSTERILSSINTASLARTSSNPENQLISLWSAIEVLLSEPQGQARIVHYASLITPCITLRHTRRQVSAIYDELLISYRWKFRKLLRQVTSIQSSHEALKFAHLMFLPENEHLRTALCEILVDNPLALHRVWKLQSDYQDVKCTSRTLSDHSDRVRWQIHRVYRARNQLVHSGRMPSYLESIILNLAEYYRSSVATIVTRAKLEDQDSDIDQIVAEIGIHYEILKSKLEGRSANTESITADDIALLMNLT
tara:strand:+ start:1109 stop:2830 length:1722 start_codon:yes stop_codon:yes gene_type:complete